VVYHHENTCNASSCFFELLPVKIGMNGTTVEERLVLLEKMQLVPNLASTSDFTQDTMEPEQGLSYALERRK
jgi:hypothetical protein